MNIDLYILGLYLFVTLIIGLWAGKGLKDMVDFSVAGRAFGSFVVFATLSASFIGGGFSLGNAEKVFSYGLIYVAALWGFSLKEMLVAVFIAPRTGNFPEAISVGDIIATRYGKSAQIITGLMSTLLCAGILGAQIGGIGYIFHTFTGIAHLWGTLIGLSIIIFYSSIGGMRAVVFTDVIQFVVLAVMIPVTLFLGLKAVGGWEQLSAELPAEHLSIISSEFSIIAFLSLFLTFLLGETLVPPYVQRLFIGRSARHTSRGTLYSGLFSVPFFLITGSLGLVALGLDPSINPNEALPFVFREVLPIGLRGIVIAAVISIMMSSADSFLNAASVAVTHDIIRPWQNSSLSSKAEMFTARIATLAVGVLATVFALSIKSILDILMYAYNFWAPVVLVPLTAVLLGAQPRPGSFYLVAGTGLGSTLIWNTIFNKPADIDGLAIGVASSLLAFVLAYYYQTKL